MLSWLTYHRPEEGPYMSQGCGSHMGALYVLVGAERLPLAGDSLDTGRYASAHLGASPTEPSSSPPPPPPSSPPPPPSY